MLNAHLIVKTSPKADEKRTFYWKNYRVTLLTDGLFRLEQSENKKFRDEATQTVWFRDVDETPFNAWDDGDSFTLQTPRATLILRENREDCRVKIGGKLQKIDNSKNLKGTYRTLDCCDGEKLLNASWAQLQHEKFTDKVELENGVCSKNGVAVLEDSASLTLGKDGEVKPERADGTDEYIFAFGNDYREAVKALYKICGKTPLVPRFALGNWWSRYYAYTDKEYLRLLNKFEEHGVPLSVATIDMDWHYSTDLDEQFQITASGKNTPFYGGNDGWTGYSWNKKLFPDYKSFLQDIKNRNLKITLNVHPADGVRWWEDAYENLANAIGRDATSGEKIPFDITDTSFVNAYFSVLHTPYEKDGVAFWWIDWQQGFNTKIEGLDPLWALNHYHYLDNAKGGNGLILSRYAGVGSHRYPLGFSGDTLITWRTLKYLPYFTATASNVGYTWWSHDIGGHMLGEKNNELYVRHLQYGVFSPINRLHSTNLDVCTKEPWAYGDGAGEIAVKWLKLRHQLIPYLYTASYRTREFGEALVEPLYYHYQIPQAYAYKNEYFFGGQLLVLPITQKAQKDKYARVKGWLPKGVWTDIFTGAEYTVTEETGKEITFLRDLESIPVFIKAGGILPLSLNEGNGAKNPERLRVDVYAGDGEYTLYEDGLEDEKSGELFTKFRSEKIYRNGFAVQKLTVKTDGDCSVIPQNRRLLVAFKNVDDGEASLFVNGEKREISVRLCDCFTCEFLLEAGKEYVLETEYRERTQMEKLKNYAKEILLCAEWLNEKKKALYAAVCKTESVDAYMSAVDASDAPEVLKAKLKEIL